MGYVGYKPYTNWRYPLKTIYEWTTEIPSLISSFCKRGYYGYAPEDTWSFDNYINKIAAPGIRRLRDRGIGWPVEMHDFVDSDEDCHILWQNILTDIADGFDAAEKFETLPYLDDYKGEVNFPGENKWDAFGDWLNENREYHKQLEAEWKAQFDHGISLFTEFYFGLWD